MAGTPAGTLEIALVADIARLQTQMKEAQRAISTMTGAANDNFRKAGKAAEDYANDVARLKSALDPAWAAQKRYNEQVELGQRAFKAGAIDRQQFVQHMRQINAELKNVNNPMQRVTASAGAQRQGMSQLSMQLNDVATQFAMGTPPMQIFAQQSGQVVQAVSLMQGGTSKLGAFLMGPWGAAIAAATLVLIPFIGKLIETATKADEATAALDRLIKKRREEAAERAELAQSEIGVNKLVEERLALEVKIENQRRRNRANGGNENQFLYRDLQRLTELDQKILEGQTAIRVERNKGAEDDARNNAQMIADRAKLAGATTATDRAQAQYNISIREAEQAWEKSSKTQADAQRLLERRTAAELALNKAQDANRKASGGGKAEQRRLETLQRETVATETLVANLYKTAAAYDESLAAGRRARIEAEATEKGMRKRADVETYVAQQLRKATAELVASSAERAATLRAETGTLANLNAQVEAGTLTAEEANRALQIANEIRPLQVAQLEAEGDAHAALTERIKAHTDALVKNFEEQDRMRADAAVIEMGKQAAQLKQEIALTSELGRRRINALKGLNGQALEEELAAINAERQKGMIAIKAEAEAFELRQRAERAASNDLKTSLLAQADAVEALANEQMDLVDLEAKFEREARAAQMLAEQVDALAGALGGLRGIGGSIGNLIGALTSSNPTAALLGMGGLGTAAGLLLGGGGALTGLTGSLTAGINSLGLFPAGSTIGAGIASGLASAGLGAMFGGPIGSIFGRGGKKGGKIGGMVGGMAFGPIGALAGSLLGGGIGALVTSTPKGRATFSGGLDFSLTGNSASRREAAGGVAEGVLGSLQQIADALGATLTGFTGTISKRGNNLRYDPSGQGITKTSRGALDFGQDEEALLKAVFEDAVSDGVFAGLSAGVERLLKGEGDIDARLQKALSFQSILDEIAAFKDPMGNALEVFDEQMKQVRDLFTEAGASAEQFADLEAYSADQRQQILDQFSQASEDERAIRELEIEIMRLQGDEQGALNAERELERQGLSASVVEMMKRRDALLDELAAAQLNNQVRAEQAALLRDQANLLQIQGDAAAAAAKEQEALTIERQLELEALDPLIRALREQRHAAQDAAAAAQQLAAAQAQAAQVQAQAISQVQGAAGIVAGGGGGGGGGSNILGALNDPILGAGVKMMLQGFSAQQAAGVIRGNVASQAATAFPNDPVRQQGFIADFEAQIAAGRNTNPNGLRGVQGMPQNFKAGGGLNAQSIASMPNPRLMAAQERAAAAEQRRAEALAREDDLRNRLADAYERESRALQALIDQWSDVSQTLGDFRKELKGQIQSPLATFRSARIALMQTAGSRDPEELSKLPGLGRDFLELALKRSSTKEDFRKHLMFVDQQVAQAEGFAEGQADSAERQLEALNRSVEGQIEIKEEIQTVAELLREIRDDQKGMRSEQLQIGVSYARDARKTRKMTDNFSLGGTEVQVGAF